MTAAERRHLERVKSLPCGVCGADGPSVAHHIREGQGMAQRAAHWLTVPLCDGCHRNFHDGDRSMWRVHKVGELDVLAATIARLCA